MKKAVISVILATLWISLSEFVRNEFLLKSIWNEHYDSMGLVFPSEPINGAVWGIWSLCYALSIYFISRKFSLVFTFLLAWWIGFVLMWLVIGNMNVLPFDILPWAIPLSLLEAFIASWIIHKFQPSKGI